jgi:hypothetical protein
MPFKALLAAALFSLVSVPATAQTTLAEASAAAKKIVHEWPLSANAVPPYDPAKAAAARGDATTPSEAPAVAPTTITKTTAGTTTKDETYWKTRMRDLTTRLAGDQTFLAAAVTVERALNTQLHRNVDDILAIRDRRQFAVVENQWQESVKEVSRFTALVQNDTRAKADLELEAHRAGVPPGWLVLE